VTGYLPIKKDLQVIALLLAIGLENETALPRARPSIAIKKRQEFKIPPFSFQIKVKLVTRLELATG
jgi:hypothetical protein